jgi:tetratricopeptide (TPR) repeat protein
MQTRALVVASLLACCSASAWADGKEEARAYFEQGNAAFALGQYGTAATAYEKAFAARPDPALLYNAAQSHRLANNKKRALLLYQNYLSVYGHKMSNKEEVQRHVTMLKQAIEIEEKSQTSPPIGTQPVDTTAKPPEPPPTARAPEPPPPTHTALPKRTKFLAGIGMLGGGAALCIAGGALVGVANAAASEINNPPPGYVFRPETESAARTYEPAGVALLAIGGAAVATGVVLTVLGARDAKKPQLAWVRP